VETCNKIKDAGVLDGIVKFTIYRIQILISTTSRFECNCRLIKVAYNNDARCKLGIKICSILFDEDCAKLIILWIAG
jgi:hypothetical protein